MDRVKAAAQKLPVSKRLVKQLGSFGLVGVVNTLIDFVIFNVLRFALQLPAVPANIISTTIAQVISFLLNKNFVFAGIEPGRSRTNTFIRFILVTAIGLYVIQSLVLALFVHYITWPGDVVHGVLDWLSFRQVSNEFIVTNTAKLIATVFSAAWNFVLYKKLVFTTKPGQQR